MRTFEASIRPRVFLLAVIAPPAGFWLLALFFAQQAGGGGMPLARFAVLIALANGLPLAALGWMLCSVAGYTVTPGKLIEHRVVYDREFLFDPQTEITQLDNGDITVRLGTRTLRLRVCEPNRCLALLQDVVAAKA